MQPSIAWVHQQLREAYGRRPWVSWGNPVSILVETILSQNTSNANSRAGFRKLWNRFKGWNKVADARVEEVARCIRISGLSNQKAPRIQQILREIRAQHGCISLRFLAQVPTSAARQYLLAFKGVGHKTANCTLLFSRTHGVFPVDTHIHRIAGRLGWVPQAASADDTHVLLEPLIPEPDRYEMHVLLIEHGRRICKAGRPTCSRCSLRLRCPWPRSCSNHY